MYLPDFLLQRWFTLNANDRHSIRKTFRSRYWISAALQLGFVGMTGTTLRSLEYVPTSVLRHLGRQFMRPAPDIATLRTLYRRRKTRFEHQCWAEPTYPSFGKNSKPFVLPPCVSVRSPTTCYGS